MRRNAPSEPPPLLEPDEVEIETSEGRRPASTAGDRMMVGLAALALLGGAIIAVTNLLPDSPAEASRATASAHASGAPLATPSPPPLRSVHVVSEQLPPPLATPEDSGGWVRALRDVNIWDRPSLSATVATLHRGDAARVESFDASGARGWLQVVAPANGWIRTKVDGRSVIRRYRSFYEVPAGEIEQLDADATGFVGRGWGRTPLGAYETRLFRSADGAHWKAIEVPGLNNSDTMQIAHGPMGWLLSVTKYEGSPTPTPWLWLSENLTDWQLLGAVQGLSDGGFGQLVGSKLGYVATSYSHSGLGGGEGSFWYSTDGLAWDERRVPGIGEDGGRLLATPLGFYVDTGPNSVTAAFSPDGWTWSEVAVGGMDTLVGLVASGDQLLALDSSSTGEGRVWSGTVDKGILAWHEEVSAGTAFDGAVVSALASDGARPIAFGWDRRTNAPLWWSRERTGWQRRNLPRGFEGNPRIAAGGPAGVVVIGYHPALTATNPVVWHLAGYDRWAPEAQPVIERRADPTPAECGDAPDDILAVIGRDAGWLAQCFGGRSLTFRAWNAPCEGCYYDAPGTAEPQWLVEPIDNLIFLTPIESTDWDTMAGVLSPALALDPSWRKRWVEVTGHYDDPAAVSCRVEPVPSEEIWNDAAQVINQCRSRFVITSVTKVRGPG
jgi:hypothetical protein